MVVCPYCFEKFDNSEVGFRCGNVSNCRIEDDPVLHSFWNERTPTGVAIPGKTGFLRRFAGAPDSAKCPECGRDSYLMICPHCHNRIPREMVKHHGYIISIVGARSSGKTVYITTLINELMRHCRDLGDIGIIACNVAEDPQYTTQQRYERDFFNVLYKQGRCPAQTQIGDKSSRIPLIYEISKKGRDSIHLVFYDTAGENFNDLKNIAGNVKFLKESDAVIFLLDTFTIPEVHDILGVKTPIDPATNPRYDTIIGNIISYFTDYEPKEGEKHFKKPIAFVFTKIDAVLANQDKFEETSLQGISINQNSPYTYGEPVSMADIESVSGGLRAALDSWHEVNFLQNIENRYKNSKFFGVSALGKAPDTGNNIKGVNPYRVLDPLVWILHEIGFPLPLAKK